jgi:hypothetical protein
MSAIGGAGAYATDAAAGVPSERHANLRSRAMAYPAYLRERARELRIKKPLSIDELAERLAVPKTTVYRS